MTTLYVLIVKLKINIFLGNVVQCSSVCDVLHTKTNSYTQNFTLQTVFFRSSSFKSTLSAYLAGCVPFITLVPLVSHWNQASKKLKPWCLRPPKASDTEGKCGTSLLTVTCLRLLFGLSCTNS